MTTTTFPGAPTWAEMTQLDIEQGPAGGALASSELPNDAVDRSRVLPPSGLGRTQVSAVIPTLNEAANLEHVFSRIPSWIHEVVIVDGHSTDDTIATAQRLFPDARIIFQAGRGKGNALACGFAAARGDIIIMLDADGSTDPGEIRDFVEPLLAGADFAKGSRYLGGGGSADLSHFRSAGNRTLRAIVNCLYGRKFTDLCYGYNAFWAHCLPDMQVDCDGFEVETLIHVRVARAGLDVREVPSIEHERLHGESNLRALRDGFRILRIILKHRFGGNHGAHRSDWTPPPFEELATQWAA